MKNGMLDSCAQSMMFCGSEMCSECKRCIKARNSQTYFSILKYWDKNWEKTWNQKNQMHCIKEILLETWCFWWVTANEINTKQFIRRNKFKRKTGKTWNQNKHGKKHHHHHYPCWYEVDNFARTDKLRSYTRLQSYLVWFL